MAPQPKRRHTKSRTNKRRNKSFTFKMPIGFGKCSACGKPKLPHKACPSCGAYK
ncbi:MAG: 50S ribosomal protein L32 [Patescibacteria group bacterium]